MRRRRSRNLFVSLVAAAFGVISFLVCQVAASSTTDLTPPASQNQIQKTSSQSVHGFIMQFHDGAAKCRSATHDEAQRTFPAPSNHGVPVRKVQGAGTLISDSASGLTINLVALSQLQTDSNRDAVIAAFQRAAATWSARIKTPITITINIDYGFNMPDGSPFDDGVVGATGHGSVSVAYSMERATLISTAASSTESEIYKLLPTSLVQVNTGIPSSAVEVSRSLGQALGYLPLDPDKAVATISFNKSFQFDFNPDNGINGSSLDFVGTATHEIGHALGFISNNGASSSAPLTNWDLFRFRSGTTPSTFTNAQRIMTTSGTQVYYTTQNFVLSGSTTTELKLSTGGPDGNAGDGNQSSHWKADEMTGEYIGIMDPTIDLGELMLTTENDFSALETFGWNLIASVPPPLAPPPADNDNFSNAFVLVGCSGTALGTNLNATREGGEPNHLSLSNNGGGTHSLWYQWQAPSSGTVTFKTEGSAYDTVLAVYTGTTVNTLTVIAQNDDIPDVSGRPHEVTSSVTFSAVAGNIYRIAVDGFNNGGDGGDMGPLKLNWFESGCNEPARLIIPEEGNPNLVAAFDSVTFVRGPFHINNPNNLDPFNNRTRVMFFIYGLTFVPDDSLGTAVEVQAGGHTLTINNLGAATAPAFSATYVVVALPPDIPAGDYPLSVRIRGVFCSNSPILQIAGP